MENKYVFSRDLKQTEKRPFQSLKAGYYKVEALPLQMHAHLYA